MSLGKVGVIGRFKPFHNGAAVLLECLCQQSDHVIIGIGSSNKYNVRNPFTAQESIEMIDAHLRQEFDNYSFITVPDFAHIPRYQDGQMWRRYVVDQYEELDHFATGNQYVADLLKDDYHILHPWEFIPEEKFIPLRATMVRVAMATNANYRSLVPEAVADYLEQNALVDRFRREYGLETLTVLADDKWMKPENASAEQNHTSEV